MNVCRNCYRVPRARATAFFSRTHSHRLAGETESHCSVCSGCLFATVTSLSRERRLDATVDLVSALHLPLVVTLNWIWMMSPSHTCSTHSLCQPHKLLRETLPRSAHRAAMSERNTVHVSTPDTKFGEKTVHVSTRHRLQTQDVDSYLVCLPLLPVLPRSLHVGHPLLVCETTRRSVNWT